MGVLLLPSKKKRITSNPALDSLNIVYNPSGSNDASSDAPVLVDPSNVKISFQSAKNFEEEERLTR